MAVTQYVSVLTIYMYVFYLQKLVFDEQSGPNGGKVVATGAIWLLLVGFSQQSCHQGPFDKHRDLARGLC
jgi:hypothetical protein